MRYRDLLEDWGNDNEHDALAHEILTAHLGKMEQGDRRWYTRVHHGGVSRASDGVFSDLESAGWTGRYSYITTYGHQNRTHLADGSDAVSGYKDMSYSHPGSPNEVRVKRYDKDDEPHGPRTVYHARFVGP